ncbi:phosphomannomutase [Devosia sp.]|uniref:phosphomannomutase n=1 Tax=Devosia sp. TaxID=1871048 RepID=UPI001ACE75AE|nr:phosphomannomutase [Devosia sp.]MBN9309363.1 phosphomannomutase [Devosia sp.]
MSDSLKFGTSGLRGLASELTGGAARRYTAAFLSHLGTVPEGRVYLGRDLRASSPAIVADCAAAIRAAGLEPVDCGVLPTPALALHAMAKGGPAIMVTGSHIPADRNGLKFYVAAGEITKADEAGIAAALVEAVPEGEGRAADESALAGDRYRQRYRGVLDAGALGGWRIGVFEHSSVARDMLVSFLTRAGADVVRLARSDAFVAVDTEAFSDALFEPRFGWNDAHQLDAVVSTDGDGDRPLVIDGNGEFVRGDVVGMLAARFLGADRVVTPVTSNSAIEGVGWFGRVDRTRVGSPFVIAGMEAAAVGSPGAVVGFEANGGLLLGTDVAINGRVLGALPTRDAVLPILAVLATAAKLGETLAGLVKTLPVRAALADRLAQVPGARSAAFLADLAETEGYAARFFAPVGEIQSLSSIDGLRFALTSGDTVHYRASGNAPELRCYVEGVTPARARELLAWGLAAAGAVVR